MQRVIHWFRQDLRLADNPALRAAAEQGAVLPVYILDDQTAGRWAIGAAGRCWLHHALARLDDSLENRLRLFRGNAQEVLEQLVRQYQISAVYWNRSCLPWQQRQDREIALRLAEMGVQTYHFNASLLWEPNALLKADGSPYQVFTPFYRNGCLVAAQPRRPLASPTHWVIAEGEPGNDALEGLALLPRVRWDRKLMPHWPSGEAGAWRLLHEFLHTGLENYQQGRDFPAQSQVSRLSPYLHWGHISVNQLWYAVQEISDSENAVAFLRELCWREFAHSLLYHFPELPEQNWQAKFNRFPWQNDKHLLRCWQRGLTGYPIVDAGMRELWQTGYMHNRLRMVVGSFLVKNLLLDWRLGQDWFWDCLVDADMANNAAGWQWVGGCGADAAPYFRIFNPVTQGQKYDPAGSYTRRFVPELASLPNKYLFCPWQAPAPVLAEAGIILGETYPKPLVELSVSRLRALAAFKQLSTHG